MGSQLSVQSRRKGRKEGTPSALALIHMVEIRLNLLPILQQLSAFRIEGAVEDREEFQRFFG